MKQANHRKRNFTCSIPICKCKKRMSSRTHGIEPNTLKRLEEKESVISNYTYKNAVELAD